MPHDDQQPVLVRETFGFDEYVAVMAGLRGRVMITDSKQVPWSAETLVLDGITLQRIFEGGSNTFEGESAEGMIGLYLRLPTLSEVRAYGRTMEAETMALSRPGYPITSTVNGVFHYYTITLPADRIVVAMEDYDPAHTERLLSGPCMVDITPESGRRVAEVAGTVIAAAAGTRAFRDPLTQRAAASELLETFFAAFTSRNPPARNVGRPQIPRRRLLREIRNYAQGAGLRDLSVPEMAARIGVADRTLRSVFREHFGVSPKKFLQIVQVHEIRADLLRARPGTTVTTIAADHGVWDQGRLAQRYRRVFGETPSQTLAASRSGAAHPVVSAESV